MLPLIEVLIELALMASLPPDPVPAREGTFNGTYLLLLILFFGAGIVALLFAAG